MKAKGQTPPFPRRSRGEETSTLMRSRPCTPCARRGLRVPAHRIMPNGEGRCANCYDGVWTVNANGKPDTPLTTAALRSKLLLQRNEAHETSQQRRIEK